MNHLEAGLEEASIKAESALTSSAAAEANAESALAKAEEALSSVEAAETQAAEALEKAEAAIGTADEAKSAADEASIAVETKQDALISGESIKTINGESVLGKGDIKVAASLDVPYSELDSASLNDLRDEGVYKIESASDVPASTSVSGTLHVNKLGDSHYEQLWYSDSNWARRINEGSQPGPEPTRYHFYINDDEYESTASSPLSITLEPGETYVLKGDLIGHIDISSSAEPAARTKLVLKGVNILSDADSGIAYLPSSKKLVVEVYANTSNCVTVDNGKEKDDAAAIYSESDLTITGTGHLSLKTNLGHALKASELVVNGRPHLVIDSVHDAFHASKLLRITGGKYEIDSCNDVFSAGAADSPAKNTVELLITDGEYTVNKCADALFQGKSSQGNYKIVKGRFAVDSANISEMFQEVDSENDPIVVCDLCEWSGFSDEQTLEINKRTSKLADQYSEPSCFYADSEGLRVDVEELGGVYTLDAGDGTTYTISGNITGKQFVTTSKKVNLNLKGVYCDETDESGTILFDYQNLKSRLQVSFTEGFINYINKQSGTIFHSDSNLALKVRADDSVTPQKIAVVYLSSGNGTVMDAYAESTSEPSRAAIAGDGICYVENSKIGVRANNLWLGNEYGDNGEADWGKAYLSLYLDGNETDADLIWKETDEAKKSGYIYAPWYLLGTCVIGGNISYSDETKKWFEAPSGTVDSIYSNTGIVYTTADVSSYQINANIVTYNPDFEIVDPTAFEKVSEDVSGEYGR